MPGQSQRHNRNLFTLAEEATHLLRRAPLAAWLAYFAGSAPFVVFLFFFWSDMSRSPLASRHVLEFSLLLALLYVWMKVWQAIFCHALMEIVEGREETTRLSWRGWMRLLGSQALVHSTMPWLLGLASIALIPFAWVYAFYHNVTVLAVGHFRDGGRTKSLLARALTQAHYEPKPNHYVIALISIFAPMVYLNFLGLLGLGAFLLKSLSGTENAFSMNSDTLMSTVMQTLLFSLSYLVVNPFVKALYVLRCFYGSSRQTGADIEVSLRTLASARMTTIILSLLLCGTGVTALAQSNTPPPSSAVVEHPTPGSLPDKELNQAIRDVLQGNEFQWRMPREKTGQDEDSWLATLVRRFEEWLENMLQAIGRILASIIEWFTGRGKGESSDHGGGGSVWLAMLPKLVAGLAVALIIGLVWLLVKHWRQSRVTSNVAVEALPPPVNLESESVLATQLPENEWLQLAREKMEAGELRLALRAFFLATLAHLGEKRLIQIARFKSNGDYVRELGWRARGRDALSEGFNQQVRTFDRVWYGWHEVSLDLMERFKQQHELLTQHAA